MFGDYIKNKTDYPDLFKLYDVLFKRVIEVLIKYNEKKKKKDSNFPIAAISIWSLLHGYSCLIIDNQKDEKVGSSGQINLVMEKLLMLV